MPDLSSRRFQTLNRRRTSSPREPSVANNGTYDDGCGKTRACRYSSTLPWTKFPGGGSCAVRSAHLSPTIMDGRGVSLSALLFQPFRAAWQSDYPNYAQKHQVTFRFTVFDFAMCPAMGMLVTQPQRTISKPIFGAKYIQSHWR